MNSPGNETPNPYQSPSVVSEPLGFPLPDSDAEISLHAKFGDKNYVLRGYADRLQIINEQRTAFDLPRRALFAKLIHGTIIRHSFRVKLDQTYVFKFSEEDFATLKNWIGHPTYADLCETLMVGNWWQLPLAGLLLFSAASMQPSVAMILNIAIASLLIFEFACSRIKPHRWICLLSASSFALLALLNAERMFNMFAADGSFSWLNAGFILVLGNFCLWWVRQFIAYGEMQPHHQ